METFADLIAAIESTELENKAAILTFLKNIQTTTKSVNDEKATLQKQIESLETAAGEGDGSLLDKVKALSKTVNNLNSELETTKTQLTEQQQAYNALERTSLIKDAANIIGLKSPAALTELLKPEEALAIEEGKVTVNGKPYETWVETDKSAFSASLLPKTTESTLPSGGGNPNNSSTKQVSPVEALQNKIYAFPGLGNK